MGATQEQKDEIAKQRHAANRGENPEARRFVQVKTVVMTSDAWRDCDYSARVAYFELSARLQWVSGKSEPVNNGHLWLSRTEWEKAAFSSATVTRAIKQLIKVGLIYRTRSGGIGRGCNEFALTSYPLTKERTGLFCAGFRKDAWANYVPPPAPEQKTRESNVNRDRFTFDELPPENGDKQIKSKQAPRIIFKHQEAESTNLQGTEALHVDAAWIAAYLKRLSAKGFLADAPWQFRKRSNDAIVRQQW